LEKKSENGATFTDFSVENGISRDFSPAFRDLFKKFEVETLLGCSIAGIEVWERRTKSQFTRRTSF